MQTTIRDKVFYFVLLIIGAVFIVLKTIRGFSDTEEHGGLWNYIQLFYIGIGTLILLSKEKNYRSLNCIKLYIIFFLYVWLCALFPFLYSRMLINQVFNVLTVPYGIMVLLVYFTIGYRNNIKQFPFILIICYLVISFILFTAMRLYRVDEGEQGAIADVYYIVGLLPLILLYMPQRYKMIPFLIAFMCVVMTGKRAAFIAMSLILLIYFFLPYSKKGKRINLFLRIIVLSIVLVITYYVVMRLVGRFHLNIFDRLENMESDGGSGRMNRWERIAGILGSDTSFLQLLFGHGTGSVKAAVGGHAHNDFFEFFFDYGFVSMVLYILFFISIFREGLKMYRHNYPYAREFMCSVAVAFCLAMFSFYAIDCTHITSSSICLGLLLSDWQKYKENGYLQIKPD